MKRWIYLSAFVLFVHVAVAEEVNRLFRFPAVHSDQIVFTYSGDLYSVSSEGGVARRLTGHDGFEMFPRFSTDGKWIAFTGQYDGNTEVFVIPSQGGVPERLTYTATLGRDDVSDRMGPNNIVMGWKHQSAEIIFRSRMKSYNPFNGQLFTVNLSAGHPSELPLPRGGFCSYSPDDSKLAYNRIFREFRTWKRYRGGMADEVWVYDFKSKKLENMTDNPAQDIIPMWHENRIYFLSDRGSNKRMNLYSVDVNTTETRRLTDFSDYDIKFPSLGDHSIVFENGGWIYLFDLNTESSRKVPIVVANDQISGRAEIVEVSKNVSNYEISPDGKRALFGARGDVFTVPAENGPTRNLTRTPGIHERNSKWSPDGKWIAYISDATGEDEIFIAAQDGKSQPVQITNGGETYKYQPFWSPDSKKLLWSDKKLRLRYVDIQSKKVTDIIAATSWEIREYNWSSDSRWVAYTLPEEETMNRIYLYGLGTGKSNPVTDGWYSASQPVFSVDGKYLYFVSNRDFNPIYSWTEWNHAYRDMSRIYLLTLAKSTESPFKPESDEVAVQDEPKKDKKNGKDESDDKKQNNEKEKPLVVDLDGIIDRIAVLPGKPAAYRSIASAGQFLYYIRQGSMDEKAGLLSFDFEKKKEQELGPVNGFEISADGKKMLISQDASYAIIDLPKAAVKPEKKLDLNGMETHLDRRIEWNQIFAECWRQMREFFYAPNMHGVNWPAIKEKYRVLLPFVNHRADLTYIIGEMISELNVGHTYVGGGEMPRPKRIHTGLLGAEIVKDEKTGAFQIKRILKGKNWEPQTRSPLTEIGVNVNQNDYILAVNGKPAARISNLYAELLNTVGKQVTLTVSSRPEIKGSREVVVIPTGDESNMYYVNWVENNISKVTKATDGRVGYLHVPDMGVHGLNEFVKYYYPQLRKKALIIDVRGNGGGNVSPMLIERLRRELAMVDMARNITPSTDPGGMLYGPKICLIDEFSASDGDLFPYRFKKYELGKLIGKRTWGGVVGIRGSLPLLDGGQLFKPEFAPYHTDGTKWIIEGLGVDPDIEVENDPAKEYAGIDQQLNRAIEEILNDLKIGEKELPPIPPYPVK